MNQLVADARTMIWKEWTEFVRQRATIISMLFFIAIFGITVRERVMESLAEEKNRYDQLLAQVVRLSKKAFELPEAGNIYVEGQSNIVRDFADLEKIQRLLRALEEKISIVRILDQTVEAHGVQIFIGMESGQEALQDCAMVTSQYGAQNHFLGAIGVIGPTRMDYPRVIPIIDYAAKILSQAISNIP